MVAQGGDKGATCAKCFASMSGNLDACPECGAPIRGGVTSIDDATSAEVARANLLRMRGDYRGAEEACLKVLKQFPNHAASHTLLGDVSAAQGDWVQAASWYELALDIVPDSATDAEKLKYAKNRIGEREQMSAAEHLGITDTPAKHYLYAGIAIVVVVALAVTGYSVFATREDPVSREPDPSINSPLALPDPRQASQQIPLTVDEPPAGKTAEEVEMLRLIRSKAEGPDKTRVLDVVFLPGEAKITLSYASKLEDNRGAAARLADVAFATLADVRAVMLRALGDGKQTFTAEAKRETWLRVQDITWRKDHSEDEWIKTLLGLETESAPASPAPVPPPNPTQPEGNSSEAPANQGGTSPGMPGDI